MSLVEITLRTIAIINAYYGAFLDDYGDYTNEPPAYWFVEGKYWAWDGNGKLIADDGEVLDRYTPSDMADRDEMSELWEREERMGRSVPGWRKRNRARKAMKRAEKVRKAELEREFAIRRELIAALVEDNPSDEFWYSLHTTDALVRFSDGSSYILSRG